MMSKTRKILVLMLAVVFAAMILTGCGGRQTQSSAGKTTSAGQKTEQKDTQSGRRNQVAARLAKTAWVADSGDYKRAKFTGAQFTLTTGSGSTIVGSYTLNKACTRIDLVPNGGDRIKSSFAMTQDTITLDGTTFTAEKPLDDDWK